MKEILIAPCGMNCQLCSAFQSNEKDINRYGVRRTYCPGCIPRGKNCLHMQKHCQLLAEGKVRFCFLCEKFPCRRLIALDRRYRDRYNMSMIDNLNCIKNEGIEAFLQAEATKWRCPTCGDVVCCHNRHCFNCDREAFLRRKSKKDD